MKKKIPSIEIERSRASDTQFLGVEHPARPPLANFQHLLPTPPPIPPPSHLDRPIALHLIQPSTENWIIMGDFNSHSPSWGYDDLDSKGEEVECWATIQQLIVTNKPKDLPLSTPGAGEPQAHPIWHLQMTTCTSSATVMLALSRGEVTIDLLSSM